MQVQIPIVGNIDNPKFLKMVQNFRTEIFSQNLPVVDGRKIAKAISVFLGPDIVSNGRFMTRGEPYMNPTVLEIMYNKVFPETGCRVERLWFENSTEYVVLLIESSKQPETKYLEQCLLTAAMTALGEKLDGKPIQTSREMLTQLDALIETLK